MAAKPPDQPGKSPGEHKQPYATESDTYRFDVVKPPTEPDQRKAGKATEGSEKTVEHPRRDGTSNKEGGT